MSGCPLHLLDPSPKRLIEKGFLFLQTLLCVVLYTTATHKLHCQLQGRLQQGSSVQGPSWGKLTQRSSGASRTDWRGRIPMHFGLETVTLPL